MGKRRKRRGTKSGPHDGPSRSCLPQQIVQRVLEAPPGDIDGTAIATELGVVQSYVLHSVEKWLPNHTERLRFPPRLIPPRPRKIKVTSTTAAVLVDVGLNGVDGFEVLAKRHGVTRQRIEQILEKWTNGGYDAHAIRQSAQNRGIMGLTRAARKHKLTLYKSLLAEVLAVDPSIIQRAWEAADALPNKPLPKKVFYGQVEGWGGPDHDGHTGADRIVRHLLDGHMNDPLDQICKDLGVGRPLVNARACTARAVIRHLLSMKPDESGTLRLTHKAHAT